MKTCNESTETDINLFSSRTLTMENILNVHWRSQRREVLTRNRGAMKNCYQPTETDFLDQMILTMEPILRLSHLFNGESCDLIKDVFPMQFSCFARRRGGSGECGPWASYNPINIGTFVYRPLFLIQTQLERGQWYCKSNNYQMKQIDLELLIIQFTFEYRPYKHSCKWDSDTVKATLNSGHQLSNETNWTHLWVIFFYVKVVHQITSESFPCLFFLAVHNSSIGDLVPCSVWPN